MKKEYKVFAISSAILIVIIVTFFERRKISNRLKNSNYTTGIITNLGKRAKGEEYVAYEFIVDGVKHYGTVNILFCHECENDCCIIGNKVKVRYEKGNPSNNNLIHK